MAKLNPIQYLTAITEMYEQSMKLHSDEVARTGQEPNPLGMS
jgi:hypothetical protein